MNYQAYSKLYNIYNEEKELPLSKKIINTVIILSIYIFVLSIIFIYLKVNSTTVIFYYVLIHTILQLLFLFVNMVLYESTKYLISFCRNIPLNPKKLFAVHFIKSNLKVEVFLEITVMSLFLLYFDASVYQIILMVYLLFALLFFRTYTEFFILWFQRYQLNFPYFSISIFLIALIIYINFTKIAPMLSHWNFTILTLIIIISIFLFIGLITYQFIVQGLIKEKNNNQNTQRYNTFTHKLSSKIVRTVVNSRKMQGLVHYHLIRLMRNTTYLSKLLVMCSTIIFFNIASDILPFMKMSNKDEWLVEIVYIGFFINFLNLTNIKMEFKLHEKLRLKAFPLDFKYERISFDIANTFFLVITFLFLLVMKITVENIPIIYVLDALKAFLLFFLLGLLLDCLYKYTVTKKKKIIIFVTYLFFGIVVEALLIANINIYIQILLFFTLFSLVYLIRYRRPSSYAPIKSRKFLNL